LLWSLTREAEKKGRSKEAAATARWVAETREQTIVGSAAGTAAAAAWTEIAAAAATARWVAETRGQTIAAAGSAAAAGIAAAAATVVVATAAAAATARWVVETRGQTKFSVRSDSQKMRG
jgi:hypothetical protein